MATLLSSLPKPTNSADYATVEAVNTQASKPAAKPAKQIPPYGKRTGATRFIPRNVEDFGDGGAFPEIHVAQYPLNMGRKDMKSSSTTAAVTVNEQGIVQYDAIAKQGELKNQIVYSKHSDLVPKLDKDAEYERPDEEEINETTEKTRKALEKLANQKVAAAQPIAGGIQKPGASQYIKYTPGSQSSAHASGAQQRIIRMVEAQVDPMEPPKFKHKRVPRGPGSPPVPVMHSPPRAVTVKDQQDWKIPPCISNWKNAKGYTIPLDKRLAADGRGLQEVQINDNFAKLSEALYIAEQKAREAVEMRAKIQKELQLKEKSKKEQELRDLAMKARMERAGGGSGLAAREAGEARTRPATDREVERDDEPRQAPRRDGAGDDDDYDRPREDEDRGEDRRYDNESREERDARLKREALREDRRRERERERRMEAKEGGFGQAKKSKLTRDRERDISEKVALGQANVGAKGETMYDQRLFNQEQGIGSGFGGDDEYNLYSKGLFTQSQAGQGLYRPKKGGDDDEPEADVGGGNSLLNTARFKPDKGFEGAGHSAGPRDKPVQFEKHVDEADPFGLDEFLTEVKKGRATDRVGRNTLHAGASGGGSSGGSGRSRIDFQ
mmetsp:Transcript_13928/g.50722  ORF Transcript_13928/g.50722 Transcript_13928/m.50722 type:complete len:611 (-) Transcript_13928:52-1884(-)